MTHLITALLKLLHFYTSFVCCFTLNKLHFSEVIISCALLVTITESVDENLIEPPPPAEAEYCDSH